MFQSTPSGGKATQIRRQNAHDPDVSIHAFRGEGDDPAGFRGVVGIVSIHAFRGEGDVIAIGVIAMVYAFQSTPSGGKATII